MTLRATRRSRDKALSPIAEGGKDMPVLVVDRRTNPAEVLHASRDDNAQLPKKIRDVPVVVFKGKTRKVDTYRIRDKEVVRPVYLKQRGLRWDDALKVWLGLPEQTDKIILIPA